MTRQVPSLVLTVLDICDAVGTERSDEFGGCRLIVLEESRENRKYLYTVKRIPISAVPEAETSNARTKGR